jgi:hypothetical protein
MKKSLNSRYQGYINFLDGRIRIHTNNYGSGSRRPKTCTDPDPEYCFIGRTYRERQDRSWIFLVIDPFPIVSSLK